MVDAKLLTATIYNKDDETQWKNHCLCRSKIQNVKVVTMVWFEPLSKY